jgi:predicted Ser/Thr protein kinase
MEYEDEHDIEPNGFDEYYHEAKYGDTSIQHAHQYAANGMTGVAARFVQKAIDARTKHGVQGVDALTIAKEALLRGDTITFESMVHMANRRPFFTNPATYAATGVAL